MCRLVAIRSYRNVRFVPFRWIKDIVLSVDLGGNRIQLRPGKLQWRWPGVTRRVCVCAFRSGDPVRELDDTQTPDWSRVRPFCVSSVDVEYVFEGKEKKVHHTYLLIGAWMKTCLDRTIRAARGATNPLPDIATVGQQTKTESHAMFETRNTHLRM